MIQIPVRKHWDFFLIIFVPVNKFKDAFLIHCDSKLQQKTLNFS
jgi:hypothetical protein